MKKYRGGYFLLLLLLMVMFTFTACNKDKPVDKDTPQTEEPADIDSKEDVNTPQPSKLPGGETSTPADGETPIDIYGINEESLESEPAHAVIKGEVTAEAIVNAVVADFKKHSIDIGIHSISQEDDKVIVSFKQDSAPISTVGSDVEETILNCISDSLMDNLSTCEAVIFRAEDGAYESGHFAFKFDEVYASE